VSQSPKQTHVIYKALALVKGALNLPVPATPAELSFPISIPQQFELEAEQASAGTNGSYIILNPGGGWSTKLWSPERFGNLVDAVWIQLGLHSIVTFGPGEVELAERILKASESGEARIADVSLKGFYALARNAKVYVGGDTGPTHLAVAAGTPIVGIFGPTEWWRNGSPRPEDICVERTDIDCRVDCHRRACSKWICMDIEVERVFSAVASRIGARKTSESKALPLAG
jgi:ADP-heptose:LPS heptosyltransferase